MPPIGRIVLVAGLFVFFVIAVRLGGWTIAFISAYLMTLSGFDAALYRPDSRVGITTDTPAFFLSDLLLASALIFIWYRGENLRLRWQVVGFLVPALVMLLLVWGNTTEQWSGLKLYATALIAFGLGRWLSQNFTEKVAFVLALACFLICSTQFVFSIAQSRGIALIPLPPNIYDWGGVRSVGLYTHPDILGTTVVLLMCFMFPLLSSSRFATNALAFTAILLGAVATLFTLGRANSFAVGAAVVLWLILGGRSISRAHKMVTIACGSAVIVLNTNSLGRLLDRHKSDPLGGDRPYLYNVALEQIEKAPLTGTGPNYYCQVVGEYDHLCTIGFPVHNSVLYIIAELGIPLAVVFLFPLLATIVTLASRTLLRGGLDVQSATLFAILPGLAAIAWTSWGLVAQEGLTLWFMSFGFLAAPYGKLKVAGGTANDEERRAIPWDAKRL